MYICVIWRKNVFFCLLKWRGNASLNGDVGFLGTNTEKQNFCFAENVC